MATALDIVKLIEKNPITRLSKNYQNNLINKIKSKFSEGQQQLFVASFFCYLNYNSKNEFIIDLDYKILLHRLVKQTENNWEDIIKNKF